MALPAAVVRAVDAGLVAVPPLVTQRKLGRTKGAKRVVAVDVTGLPVAALVVPASAQENLSAVISASDCHRHFCASRTRHFFTSRM